MRTAPLTFALLTGLLAACASASSDEASVVSTDALQGNDKALAFEKSFVVTDPKSLAAIQSDFAMGTLLYSVNEYLASITAQWNKDHPDDPKKVHDDRTWALNPFQVASNDVQGNNAVKNHVGNVWPIIDTVDERVLPKFDPAEDKVGPFRLLSVINRLDLTGDFDLRGGGVLAGAERRWFGEGRLVFGLSAPLDAKTPFPMTWIMEYRLPALKLDAHGNIVVDPDFDFAKGPASMDDWIQRRKLWATVWKSLSAPMVGSGDYVNALRNVVSMFATGKNHLALRSGEQVRAQKDGAISSEFEYREFYLDDAWMLATRKLRREPFACSQQSTVLGGRITGEWNATTKAMDWNYTLGERNLSKDEIAKVTAACGGQLPYGQDNHGDSVQLRAKFARFEASTYWAPAVQEDQRHQFAVGTCTGCHAAESNVRGFQIAPSLPGNGASLSAFLSGPTAVSIDGVSYSYDEPSRRTQLLKQFLNGVDVPGDMLHNLDCNDVDTCKVQ